MTFSGIWCSLVTPFKEGGDLDLESAKKYVEYLDQYDFAGFLVGGSVGEGLLLNITELKQYVELVRSISKKKIMIGVIEFNYDRAALKMEIEADFYLVTPCIYFKPSDDGIVRYVRKLAENYPKNKIVLYNNPSRVGVAFNQAIYSKLYPVESIVGVKECVDDQFQSYRNNCPNWSWLSGNDNYEGKTDGLVSTLANIAPELCFDKRDTQEWHDLCRIAYAMPNPMYVKKELARRGYIGEYFRAPFGL